MKEYGHFVVPQSIEKIFFILIEKNGEIFDILFGDDKVLQEPIFEKFFDNYYHYDLFGEEDRIYIRIEIDDVGMMIDIILKYDYVPEVHDLWTVLYRPKQTCVICRDDIIKKNIIFEDLPSNLQVKYLYYLLNIKKEDVLKVSRFLKLNRRHFYREFNQYFMEELLETAVKPYELLVIYQLVNAVVYSSLDYTRLHKYTHRLSSKVQTYYERSFFSSKEEKLYHIDERLERLIRQECIEDAIQLSHIESYGEFLGMR
jgi:AraC-like DNA-binding protein